MVINAVSGSSSGRIATKIAKSRFKLYCENDNEILKKKHADYAHIAKNTIYNLRDFFDQASIQFDGSIPPLNMNLTDSDIKKGKEIVDQITNKNNKEIIALYTFATGDKCYSKEWWKEFYTEIKQRYSEDYNIIEVLPKENVSQIDFEADTYYSTDIFELATFIANTKIFITGDCGIMHLASAAGVLVLGMFSITNPEIYGVYNHGSISIVTSQESISNIIKIAEDCISKK